MASPVTAVKQTDASSAMEVEEPEVDAETLLLDADQLRRRIQAMDGNVRFYSQEEQVVKHQIHQLEHQIKENKEKIKRNTQRPWLVATILEVLKAEDLEEDDGGDDAAEYDDGDQNQPSVVIKTATRQTIYINNPGIVPAEEMEPGDLVGVNKDSYLIIDKLPQEFDSRAKAMELETKPDVNFNDVGGLEKQIEQLVEAIVLPIENAELFSKIGIQAPKGVLLFGPPGTGKTMLARAVANAANACFLKLAGPQLVQMYIGDGAKIVRDAFTIAKKKAPAIVFIDELDAVGAKRGGEGKGDREVQRTMLELLNQLDGFSSDNRIKVVAATNRPDILDPALLRSGRIDRKVECPLPNERARERILRIHALKLNVDKESVRFEELSRMTVDFNGAQLKAVVVEAGMLALRREANSLEHEDFVEGIAVVRAKKKTTLNYYA